MNNLLSKEQKKSSTVITDFDRNNMMDYASQYFSKECTLLSYPAKSYCVAVIYAHLLNFYFNEDFFEVLNDPELLCLNDDYFVPYLQEQEFYDLLLGKIGMLDPSFKLNLHLSQIHSTFHHFLEEFSVKNTNY